MKHLDFRTYKLIRKMSLNDMNRWVLSVYRSGYTDGLRDGESEQVQDAACVTSLSDERLMEILLSVKGIGRRRAEMVIEAIINEDTESEEGAENDEIDKGENPEI